MARSLQEIQNDINAAYAASEGKWTSELNALVAEKKAAEKGAKPSQTRTLTPAPDYSLGDVEYRWGIDPYVKDDPLALLALNEIERLTGGDYGQIIKAVTRPNSPFEIEKRVLDKKGVPSIYGTSWQGFYAPEGTKVNPAGNLPQIAVNTTDFIDEGTPGFFPDAYYLDTLETSVPENIYDRLVDASELDKRNIPPKDELTPAPQYPVSVPDEESFFNKIRSYLAETPAGGLFGVTKPNQGDEYYVPNMEIPPTEKKSLLQKRREDGSMPTAEDMELLKTIQGTGRTTRHELDHFGFDVLRALGYDIEPENESRGYHEHKHYTDPLDEEPIYGYKLGDLGNKYAELARKELKNRRGYAQGGIASIRKVA